MINQMVKEVIDKQYEEIFRDCFGSWITSMWGKYDESFSFAENKDAFFYLIGRLLNDGRVTFDHPHKPEPWNASPETILNYLREFWPANAETENDPNLHMYFYRIPGILWRGDDGQWHGS